MSELFGISLVDFLARQGHRPTKVRGHIYWYLSPYRNESTASFNINTDKNVWYDFGTGEGGGIIALAKLMFGTESVMEIMQRMDGKPMAAVKVNKPPCETIKKPGTMNSRRIVPLSHPALTQYLESRGIRPDIAKRHCTEMHYRIGKIPFFAIAFANDYGGYELRNRYFKGCTGSKEITVIHSKDFNPESELTSVHVFEGFISFLSFLVLVEDGRIKLPKYGSSDYIVLNSVINVGKALPVIDSYDRVFTYLDNDVPGQKATEVIVGINESSVIDMSFYYHPHNDLNDYLCEQIKSRRENVKQ